ENFVPSQTWTVIDNPVMRSVSSNKSAQVSTGAGAGSFASISATVGVSLLRYPLVPRVLGYDSDFRDQFTSALPSARILLVDEYESKDPHALSAKALVPAVDAEAQKLKDLLETLRSSITSAQADDFEDCLLQISTVHRRVQGALAAKPAESL